MPTILPDNTEVNGKMKMKCLNVNGSNITEIITGPKITYRSGERSFLKSISIDGYRLTISYIDDLFKGETVEVVLRRQEQSSCNLRRNGLDVIYVKLYPSGEVNIKGEAYDSVRTSWKSISFNISADIQDGYIRRENEVPTDSNLLTFDFVLPPPSEHTLYSSFISDMKYMPRGILPVGPEESLQLGRGHNPTAQIQAAVRQELKAQRINDRLDELENKLRKFGIE